jgi:autotransporter-associated beta strand protein
MKKIFLLCLTACVASIFSGHAQTSWTGNASQNWTTATWSAGVPISSSNISLSPTGAFTLSVDTTAAVGAALDFNSANNVVLSLGSNRLTLSGNVTDTGAGNADITIGNGTSADAALTANNIAARQITITNGNSTNQNRISANSITTSGEFRIAGVLGGGFFTFGNNITVTGSQFIINNASGNNTSATYTQTGATLRNTNSGFGVVIGGEVQNGTDVYGTNTFNLNGGAIEALRIGVNNGNGNNNNANRYISNGTLNFNEGTIRPTDTTSTLNFQNGFAFNTYNGTGTKDMSWNTSAPLLVRLAATGNHTFAANGTSSIVISPSARLLDQTSGGTLLKTGSGNFILTGGNTANTNTWSGNTTVQGGLISVDYNLIAGQAATGNTDLLSNAYSSASRLVLDGGNFTLTGRGSASSTSATNVAMNAGTTQFTVSSTSGLVVGQAVTNANLPSGTYIRRIISGTSIELNAMSTSTINQTGQTLNFGAASFANTQTMDNVTLNATTSTITVNPGAGSSTTLLSLGNVTGSGGLTKAGTGTLQLTGQLNYTGATAISSGTLELAPASGTSTLTGNVTGAGALVKSGAGTIILAPTVSAGNTFSGALSVNGGVLQIGNATTGNNQTQRLTAVSSITVASGATITLGASTSVPDASPITLNGTLNTISTSQTNRLGPIAMNGGTLITNNAPSSAFQSYILNGNITVGGSSASTINSAGSSNNGIHLAANVNNTTRVFNVADATSSSAGDLFVSAALLNSSANATFVTGLEKTGAGTMVLSASNAYTGATTISAGTLLLNGSLAAASSVSVANGATLGGTGSFAGSLQAAGVLAPGNSIGTLNAGTTTWVGVATPGLASDWQFELGPGNTADRLAITGNFLKDATAGSNFRFDFLGASQTGSFTLVTWSGTSDFAANDFSFTNLNQSLSGSFEVSAGYLVFNAVPEPGTWALLAIGTIVLVGARFRSNIKKLL